MTTFAHVQKRHIRLMRLTCDTLGNILAGVSQDTATTLRDGPEGWTTLEVVCHLRDFDCFFLGRAQMMLKGDYPLLPAYDHERIAIDCRYNEQNLQAAYAALRASREQFARFFENLNEGQWAMAGVHPENGHWTMLDSLMQVGLHDATHLEQITRILSLDYLSQRR
jgi:hypothetical protein